MKSVKHMTKMKQKNKGKIIQRFFTRWSQSNRWRRRSSRIKARLFKDSNKFRSSENIEHILKTSQRKTESSKESWSWCWLETLKKKKNKTKKAEADKTIKQKRKAVKIDESTESTEDESEQAGGSVKAEIQKKLAPISKIITTQHL